MRKAVLLLPLLLAACGRQRAMPVLPEFALTAVGPRAETPFTRRDMLGRVWVVDFVFTRCGGPCPLLTERLAALGRRLPPEARLLTITVDPSADTPERMREYALARGMDLERWVFARGTVEQTYQLLFAGFKLPLSTLPDAPAETRVTHTTRMVLVGERADIRGYYEGLDDRENAALERDALKLIGGGS
jgi:protein SCO1